MSFIQARVMVNPEPIPGMMDMRQEYTLDRIWVHCRTHRFKPRGMNSWHDSRRSEETGEYSQRNPHRHKENILCTDSNRQLPELRLEPGAVKLRGGRATCCATLLWLNMFNDLKIIASVVGGGPDMKLTFLVRMMWDANSQQSWLSIWYSQGTQQEFNLLGGKKKGLKSNLLKHSSDLSKFLPCTNNELSKEPLGNHFIS